MVICCSSYHWGRGSDGFAHTDPLVLKPQRRALATQRPWLEISSDLFREHGVVAVILILGFVMRLFLAEANSYWLDELYSVVIYGIDNKTVFEAISKLTKSIHPPLYQFILYYWMTLFGDGEIATRTLSNLYVTGATLCLYILVFRLYGLRMAIATALVFSLMYIPIYYALETRSYAQTLFLASLSSLLLYKFLRGLTGSLCWKGFLRDWCLLALLAANFALLLTHYYNVFFLGAQSAFLLAYLLLKDRRDITSTALKAVVVGTAPLILLLLTWGPVMAASYARRKSSYAVDIPTEDPLSLFFGMVAQPNLAFPTYVLGVMSLLLLPRLTRAGIEIYRGDAKLAAYFDFYFLLMALLPFVLAYLLFLVSGHQRHSSRYFVFCTPPLAVLLVLSIEVAVQQLARLASFLKFRETVGYRPLVFPFALLAVLLVVLPGGYAAATKAKTDWRGIAARISSLVVSEPDKNFIVYETTFRDYPTLNYYLSRYSKSVRVHDNVSRSQERSGNFAFVAQANEIGKNDYLLLAFTHHTVHQFPKALKQLEQLYPVYIRQLDKGGRGLVVFKTSSR